MKKFMAVAVALIMALSMCSFSVMAAVEVDFADIANGQLQDFVVTDLDFSGYSVTSSDTAIIAEDGAVTRPLFEDKVVTLTVDGTPIDVTVKAQTAEILYSNDFSEELGDAWELNVPEGNTAPSVADGVFNVIIGETTVNRTNLNFTMPELVSDGKVTLAFDMDEITDVAASGVDIRMDGVRYDENGEVVGSFNTVTIARCTSNQGFGSNWMGAYGKGKFTFTYDPVTGEFWGNGKKVAPKENEYKEWNLFDFINPNSKFVEGKSAEDVAKVAITKIFICNAGGGCTGTFNMDNLVVTQELSVDDVLQNATPDQKAGYYAQYLEEAYVANGGSFKAIKEDLVFAAELPEDVTITWETDESLIKADGTVIRDLTEKKTTTITGTVSVDGAEDIVKSYDVTLLPLNIVAIAELLDAEYGVNAGTSLVGMTGWKPSSVKPYESMTVQKEANGNSYMRFGVASYEPTASTPEYTFQSVPTIDGAEKLVFEGRVRNPEVNKKGASLGYVLRINGKEEAKFINYNGYIYDQDYIAGKIDPYYGLSNRNDVAVTAGEWYDLKVVIDLKEGTSESYINNKLVGEHDIASADGITAINSVAFAVVCRGTMDSITEPTYTVQYCDVDDVQVYTTMSDADAFVNANDEVKFNFLKQSLNPETFANGESLAAITKDLKLIPEGADLDALGATFVWESSDESVIANDGTITPDALIGKTVILKGTLTVGSMAPVSASYAVTVAPAGTAPYTTSAKENFLWDFEDKEDGEVDPMAGSYDNNVKGFGVDGKGAITYVEDAERGMVAKFAPESEYSHLKFCTGSRSGNYVSRYIAGIDFKYDMLDEATKYELTYLFRGNSGGYAQGGISNSDGTEVATIAPADSNVDGVQRKGTVDMLFGYKLDHVESIFNDDIWHNITIDYNTKANVYYVYFDGVLVSNAPSSTGQIAGYPMIWMQLSTRNMESVLIDNHYVVEFTDADAVTADAALKAALYNAVSRETGQSGEPGPYRQIHRNDLNSVLVNAIPTPQTAANGATLKWMVNGVEHTADTFTPPANADVVDFKVTATYNGKSATESFSNRMASVKVIDFTYATIDGNQSFTAAKISGDVAGKKLIVKYTSPETGKTMAIDFYTIADYYNAETGVFTFPTPYQYAGEGGGSLKCYIWDASGITPISFER